MSKEQEVESLLLPVAEKEKIEIIDINCVKENNNKIVRIFIDKDNGVTMSDCENMSRIFSAALDKSDILTDSYILEVSSPGLNRVLKKEENFKRFKGSKVRIQTFNSINNQKNFLGVLLDFNNGKVKISDVTNGIIEIDFSDIKKANIETDI
jgi:ribosome maturation factor RimP